MEAVASTSNVKSRSRSGACCLGDDTCVDSLTISQRASTNGSWQGDGTSCTVVDCGPDEEYVELHHAIVGSGLLW